MRQGTIYVITNKTNGLQYVGQTARDIDTRFYEHCIEKRGHSKLHEAIQKEGWRNFKIEELESVPLDKLDERECFWIQKLDTRKNGYNIAAGGKGNISSTWPRVQVVENGLIFDSKEDMGRLFSEVTSWSLRFLTTRFKKAIQNNEELFGYHFKEISPYEVPSDIDVLKDWIKTINIKYVGKHIYCKQLDMEFETIASAAKYLLDNGLYVTKSKTPVQSLVTSIGRNIHGKSEYIKGERCNYIFEEVPGVSTKNHGGENFSKSKIFCPELNIAFDSQVEAAKYFIDNSIWTGIKLKTAKLRISDIVRGAFQEYKGYTFQKLE